MKRLLRGAILALSCLPAYAAGPNWQRVASGDFEIFSTAAGKDTLRALDSLARAKSFIDQNLPPGIRPQKGRVRVILFGSKKEYEEYRFKPFAVAYSARITGRDYVVLDGSGGEAFATAIHEYIHLLTEDASLHLPPWLSEGIAELFTTLKFTGGKVVVGAPPPARVQALGRDSWVPLSEITGADRESPYYTQTGKAGTLYNEGWALVHMLHFSLQYGPGFGRFMEEVQKGTDSRRALEKVYGQSPETVEKELKAYLRRGYFATRVVSAPAYAGKAVTAEPAAMFDVSLALLDLSSRLGKTAETRAGLENLMREDPSRPEPHVTLGYLLIRNYQEQDALPSFEMAMKLGSHDPEMLWDYGRLAGPYLPEQATAALQRLLAHQPARSDVRLELAEIQMSRRRPAEALETLAPVNSAAPESSAKLHEILAMANLEVGNREAAVTHARRWLAAARDSSQRTNAARIVRFLEESSQ